MKTRSKTATVLLIVVLVLVGLRVALPWMLEDYVNRQLASLDGYGGQVEDIDVALWRGAYQIEGIVVEKEQAEGLEPFFVADAIDLAVDWGRLLDGAVVAEVIFWRPELNMVEAEDETQAQTGEEEDWQEQFEQLFPFRFDSIKVRDGTVRFRTPGIQTEDAITLSQLNGELKNLTNVVEVEGEDEAFATFDFESQAMGAKLLIVGRAEPTAEQPTFDVNATLDPVQVTELNPWMREYLNADAHAGIFALYLELAAKDGRFEGYAKPFTENIEIFDLDDESKGILQKAWEATLDVTAGLFESDEEDVATRIPISGTIEEPEAGIWRTFVNVLRHAFTGAFTRSLENSVELEDGEIKEDV